MGCPGRRWCSGSRHWGGVKLTVPMLNRIKDVNPRQLERVYDEVLRTGDAGNARFALGLILK